MESVKEFLRRQKYDSLLDFRNQFIANRNIEIDYASPVKGLITRVPDPIYALDNKEYRHVKENVDLHTLIYSCGDPDLLTEAVENNYLSGLDFNQDDVIFYDGYWRPITDEILAKVVDDVCEWGYQYKDWIIGMSRFALPVESMYDDFKVIGAQALSSNRLGLAYVT